MKALSLPVALWIAGGLIAIAGVQTWRLHSLETEYAQLEASVATGKAARATAYAADSDKTAGKEQAHAQTTQGVLDVFTQGQGQRDAALSNDLQRARRLLNASEQRAAGYRAQAEAGAVACSRLADRSAALDRQLAEGLGVVSDLRGVVDRRDAEVVLLRGVIDADRALLAQ
jgi:hypothetical protein